MASTAAGIDKEVSDATKSVSPQALSGGINTTKVKLARFVKLAKKGVRSNNASNWSCVTDRKTGLTWERKGNWGIRWQGSTFTNTTNMPIKRDRVSGAPLRVPVIARGVCVSEGGNLVVTGEPCHTEGYVKYMNDKKFCGYTDWRLPSKAELLTILDLNTAPPFFADRNAYPYPHMFNIWTSTRVKPYSNNEAVRMHLQGAISPISTKRDTPTKVLLVRGQNSQN